VQVVNGDIQILRLARGFAPRVLKLEKAIDKNI
jgi:hydrogenase maturation factor HypF (carbamoyltransferase family)